jgi:radical SAM superfamily enzyme
MVVHRITGDGPKKILRAPLWSGNKRMVLNTIHHKMKVRNLKQGSHYKRD